MASEMREVIGFTVGLDVEGEEDFRIKGDAQALGRVTGQMVAPFPKKRKLKLKKLKSPGCWMVTQMAVGVGRNAECLCNYVSSWWPEFVYTLHVGGHAFMFVYISALSKVNAYVWCGMTVYAY